MDNETRSVLIQQCRHGMFAFLKGDHYIGRSLQAYGEYSEGEVRVLSQVLSAGSVVVEAGANIGTLTLPLAQICGPQGRVYAYEPCRTNFHLLCTNLVLNELDNVMTFRQALGKRRGMVDVPAIGFDAEENYGGIQIGSGSDTVPIGRIDDLNLDQCTLIKIDVEGSERNVLMGAAKTIAACRPCLYVEDDRPDLHSQLIKTIFNMDYRIWWHTPPLFLPNNFHGNSMNIFPKLSSFNLFCLPKDTRKTIDGMIEITSLDTPHPLTPRNQL